MRFGRAGAVGIACLLAGLSGCGYALKGSTPVRPALASVYLEAPDRYSDLNRALIEALASAGVTLRAERGTSGAVLVIRKDETGRRVMSVSVRNVPTEFEVYYNATYGVSLDGSELIKPTELSLSRIINYDETQQLEKEKEEAIVRDALAHDLAERIVRQLAAL